MPPAAKLAPKTNKGALALRLNALRQVHIYISVFVAPMLLFWASTGALQVFRIPDKHPQAVIAKLASVHKTSTYAGKAARAAPPAAKGGAAASAPKAAPAPKKPAPVKPATTALKWYFALASVLLMISTLVGLWMAFAHHRRRGLLWLILAAGAAVPVGLLVAAG
ncbi:MAG: hypothetical protein JWM33_1834 [Caulobacteraceae bacterium]|nr:hypothetical protein [Caulobacteraceae bacterium]